VVLWPFGAPTLFAVALRGRRSSGSSRTAIRFLTADYVPSYFFWEVIELLKKLTLCGFLLFVQHSGLRLVFALLVTIAYVILLLHARPFREPSTTAVAVLSNVALLCAFQTALLIVVADKMALREREELLGTRSEFGLAMLLVAFNFGVVLCVLLLLLYQLRSAEQRVRALRLRYADGTEARHASAEGHHVFLSHKWQSGQDQMRIVKQRLGELLPGIRVFLDVDEADLDLARCARLQYCFSSANGVPYATYAGAEATTHAPRCHARVWQAWCRLRLTSTMCRTQARGVCAPLGSCAPLLLGRLLPEPGLLARAPRDRAAPAAARCARRDGGGAWRALCACGGASARGGRRH